MLNFLVGQTNLYALQVDINKPAIITRNEKEKFKGMVIYMSLVKLPSSRLYWNTNLGQEFIHGTMSCNRWETIKRFLHLNNNDEIKLPGSTRYSRFERYWTNSEIPLFDFKLLIAEHLCKSGTCIEVRSVDVLR